MSNEQALRTHLELNEWRTALTGLCIDWPENAQKAHDQVKARLQKAERVVPVYMVLYCPKCGMQHIDAADRCAECPGGDCMCVKQQERWTNPPHKSHLCHGCGHIWRPSDTPTNGIKATTSGKDADTAPLQNLCPDCHGSGESKGMEGAGPDTYEVDIPCPTCQGTGDAPRTPRPLLLEAWDFGQFADDVNQPLPIPLRRAIRQLCEALDIKGVNRA